MRIRIWDTESVIFFTLDLEPAGPGLEKFVSGINILDPQHWHHAVCNYICK
jgi:hypothetical protein